MLLRSIHHLVASLQEKDVNNLRYNRRKGGRLQSFSAEGAGHYWYSSWRLPGTALQIWLIIQRDISKIDNPSDIYKLDRPFRAYILMGRPSPGWHRGLFTFRYLRICLVESFSGFSKLSPVLFERHHTFNKSPSGFCKLTPVLFERHHTFNKSPSGFSKLSPVLFEKCHTFNKSPEP